MLYTPFGKTGTDVSRLGFGGMRFEEPDNIDAMAEVVFHAHEKGITYFDTAPYYCNDKSEEIVGTAVKEMKKTGKPFYIATKCGAEKGEEVRESLERSLKRLNVDSIDFFHCWCVLSPDKFDRRIEHGAISAMKKAKEEGLIKHMSISTHMSSKDMKTVLAQEDFASVLCGYNVLNFRLRGEGIAFAKEKEMGVVVMNPLGGGLVPEFADTIQHIKRREDQSVVHAALDFIWSNENIDVALVGMRNKSDVDDTVAAAEAYTPPDKSWLEKVAQTPSRAEGELCTQCCYCDVCPEKIPVFKYMDAYNFYLLRENWQDVFNRLKWHWGIKTPDELKKCTACGSCEDTCTQHLDIIARLKEMRQNWPEEKENK